MANKSARSSWCILRDNERLRSIIEFQIKKKNLKLIDVANLSGVAPDRLSKWRNRYTRHLTQYQLIKVANVLGLQVDITINFKDE